MQVLVIKGALLVDQLEMYRAATTLPNLTVQVVGVPVEGAPDGKVVRELKPFKVWRSQLGWLYRDLSSVIATFKPDLLHVGLEPWALLMRQALASGIPTVGHGCENQRYTHGSLPEAYLRPRLARRNLPHLSGFASWNSAGIALAKDHGLRAGAPTLVVPGDLPDPRPFVEAASMRSMARARFAMLDERRYVGFVGRLTEPKGVHVLIDALAYLGRPGIELVLAGVGPMASHLIEHAHSVGVQAHFLGQVSADEIPVLNAACDVIAVPSLTTSAWSEQYGRVAPEAMFAATPLVVSDSGALPEVVGEYVSVVREGDPEALARAIGRLLEGEKARRVARLAQQDALQRFSPEVLAQKLEAFWRSSIQYSKD